MTGKKKFINALKIPAYSKFIDARDRALERILLNSQRRQSEITASMLTRMRGTIAASLLIRNRNKKSLEQALEGIATVAGHQYVDLIKQTRKLTWLLSYVGEAEAIGRVSKHFGNYSATHDKLNRVADVHFYNGGAVADRIKLYLDRMVQKLMDRYVLGMIRNDPSPQILDAVMKAMPKTKSVKKIKALFKIKEATKKELKPANDWSMGYIDDVFWDAIVDEYKNEYVPDYRSDEMPVLGDPDGPVEDKVYAWDVENQITEDFVWQVRAGQSEAANENGITDFVWIAIVDDKTDDCCLWRDGLLTSEIEEALSGDHKDDECDAVTPPAHFNCRCRIAPALESLQDGVESRDMGDFSEWLEN